MGEKLGVGWFDVLRDLRWWIEEDGRPEVWNAGEDLLAFYIEWTKGMFLDSLWIDRISVTCGQALAGEVAYADQAQPLQIGAQACIVLLKLLRVQQFAPQWGFSMLHLRRGSCRCWLP